MHLFDLEWAVLKPRRQSVGDGLKIVQNLKDRSMVDTGIIHEEPMEWTGPSNALGVSKRKKEIIWGVLSDSSDDESVFDHVFLEGKGGGGCDTIPTVFTSNIIANTDDMIESVQTGIELHNTEIWTAAMKHININRNKSAETIQDKRDLPDMPSSTWSEQDFETANSNSNGIGKLHNDVFDFSESDSTVDREDISSSVTSGAD